MQFEPAFVSPAVVLPAAFSEATSLTRPVLVAGPQPRAVVILLEIEAQGVEN